MSAKRNPVANYLRAKRPQVIRPKRGKGSYDRKRFSKR